MGIREHSFITIIVAVLGVFALTKYIKENKNNCLILCILFIAPLILALFTDQPSRWLYFLPIPLFICFGLFLRYLFSGLKKDRIKLLLVVISLILIIASVSIISSVNRMETSMSYYQSIGKDEIDALNWVKYNTASNSVFATSGPNKIIGEDTYPGSSYSWWIEGFSQRKSLHTGLLSWYTYEDERLETNLMNRIFAGAYNIEFGNIRVSDDFPSANKNPEIAALIDGRYQNLLFLNDAEQTLVSSPTGNDSVIWQNSLFEANNKTITIFSNETLANVTYTYSLSNFDITRNIIVGLNHSSVDIIYNVSSHGSVFNEFKINFWASYYASIYNYVKNESSITLSQKLNLSGVLTKTNIEVLDTNGLINEANVLYKDSKYSIPVVVYSIKPLEKDLSLHFRVSLNDEGTRDTQVYFFNSYNLLKAAKVDYVFLNKSRLVEFSRFINDTGHYAKIFENTSVVILKVL